MIYRQADEKDLSALKKLGQLSYREFSEILTPENRKKLERGLENENELFTLIEKSTVFVCESENQIIGMAYLVPAGNPTEHYREHWAYIRYVGVSPNFRGQGIGKALTLLCIEQAQKQNAEYIALHTSEFMHTARYIYENFGFKKVKAFEHLGKQYWIYLKPL